MIKRLLLFQVILFSFITLNGQTPAAPATISAAIGYPANGTTHHLSVSWTSVAAADGYSLEYSTDGSTWNVIPNITPYTTITYDYNAGDNPNAPYYFRIRAYKSTNYSSYTTMASPVYTACDFSNITAINPTSSSIDINLQAETPVANPVITTYSIYCTTLKKWVQADGTLGTTEVFQSKSQWGNNGLITVTGFSVQTQYCFYAKSRNQDGDTRVSSKAFSTSWGTNGVQTFNSSNVITHNNIGGTKWWIPDRSWAAQYNCDSGRLKWLSAGGCSGGNVGVNCTDCRTFDETCNTGIDDALVTPMVNCGSAGDYITLKFDLTNTAFNFPKNYIDFTGEYIASQTIFGYFSGVNYFSANGQNTDRIILDHARSCETQYVKIKVKDMQYKSNLLFWINLNCQVTGDGSWVPNVNLSLYIDNISIVASQPDSVCATTTLSCSNPIITSHPSNNLACTNQGTSFTVTASGTAPFSYQWKKNNSDLSGATKSVYTIASVTSNDAGTYSCIVRNACGSTNSNNATLNVNSIPLISYITPPQVVCSRENASFQVTGNGNLLSYQWYKGNNIITGATNSAFAIGFITYSDTAKYKCTVSNICGMTSAITSLSVNASPIITNTIDNTSICEGGNISFKIEATGNIISYQWTIGGVGIPGATNTIYTLTNLKQDNANVYSCIASSLCGNSKLKDFLLTVLTLPQINISPVTQTKNTGESISYSLSPGGAGTFTYQWRKGNKDIQDATNYQYNISSLKLDDTGIYSCIISNICGSITTEVGTLIVVCPGCTSSVSGKLIYDNVIQTAILNTTIYLETNEGIKLDSTVTGISGDYAFSKLANGTYKLVCSKSKLKWGGTNPVDALLINRYVAKLYKFGDSLESRAADVDGSTYINSVDALLINRRYAKLLNQFMIPDWLFESPVITINNDSPVQNIKAICAGDVNSSYPN